LLGIDNDCAAIAQSRDLPAREGRPTLAERFGAGANCFQAARPGSAELPRDPVHRGESLLGARLAGEKKYAEAEPLLLGGYQGMLARKNASLPPIGVRLAVASSGPTERQNQRILVNRWEKGQSPTGQGEGVPGIRRLATQG